MGALVSTLPTLQDVAKAVDPDGSIAKVAEVLTEKNEILLDMPWKEGNLPTGHQSTIDAALPDATWRLLNYGVKPTKGATTQVTDVCGMLEAWSDIDKDIAMLNGNTAAFRAGQDRQHIESIAQSLAATLFYGNTAVNPERFVGLSPRYSVKSTDKTKTGYNVIDAGGTTNLSSIWLVGWGEDTAFGIYPKGSQAGLMREDLGETTLFDAAGGKLRGYSTHFQFKAGIAIPNWKSVVRIANIDMVALATASDTSDTSANILKLMHIALNRIPSKDGNVAFYMNNDVLAMLGVKMMDKANIWLSLAEYMGKPRVLQFQGVPCRRVDQILNSETRVT